MTLLNRRYFTAVRWIAPVAVTLIATGLGLSAQAQRTVKTHANFTASNQSVWGAGQTALQSKQDLTTSWDFDVSLDFTFDFNPGIPGTTLSYDFGKTGPGYAEHRGGTMGIRHTIYSDPGSLNITYPIDFTATTKLAGRHGVKVDIVWQPTPQANASSPVPQTMTVTHGDVNYGVFFIFDSRSSYDTYFYVGGTKYDSPVSLPWTLTIPMFDTASLTNTAPDLLTAEQFNPLGFSVEYHPHLGDVNLTASADITGQMDAQNNPTQPILDMNGNFTQLIVGLIDLADVAKGLSAGLKSIGDPTGHDPEHGQQGATPNSTTSQILGVLGEALSLAGFPFQFQFDVPTRTGIAKTDFGINWDFLDLHGDLNLTTAEEFHFKAQPYVVLHVYQGNREIQNLKKTLNLYGSGNGNGVGGGGEYVTTLNLGSLNASQVRIVPEYFLGSAFTTTSNVTSNSTLQFVPLISDVNISAEFFLKLDLGAAGTYFFDTGSSTYKGSLPQTYTRLLSSGTQTDTVYQNTFAVQGFSGRRGALIWP